MLAVLLTTGVSSAGAYCDLAITTFIAASFPAIACTASTISDALTVPTFFAIERIRASATETADAILNAFVLSNWSDRDLAFEGTAFSSTSFAAFDAYPVPVKDEATSLI